MYNLHTLAKKMGNDDYQLSDHKYLIVECTGQPPPHYNHVHMTTVCWECSVV